MAVQRKENPGVAQIATVIYGYSLADIDRMANKAYGYSRVTSIDTSDGHEAAWHAIVEALYTSSTDPGSFELIGAGMRAVRKEAQDQWRHQGWDWSKREIRPSFEKFWLPILHVFSSSDGFSDHVCDRMALPQVLYALGPTHYQVLVALAAYNDRPQAARALGMTDKAFEHQLYAARAAALATWFDDETPKQTVKPAESDEACRFGHIRADHGRRVTGKSGAEVWRCVRCATLASRRQAARKRT